MTEYPPSSSLKEAIKRARELLRQLKGEDIPRDYYLNNKKIDFNTQNN